jgi:hypothetical protein
VPTSAVVQTRALSWRLLLPVIVAVTLVFAGLELASQDRIGCTTVPPDDRECREDARQMWLFVAGATVIVGLSLIPLAARRQRDASD